MNPPSELHALLVDATGALARLDADALESMSARVLVLRDSGTLEISAGAAPEFAARLRVFSAAMQATRANLDFMAAIAPVAEARSDRSSYGRGVPWGR